MTQSFWDEETIAANQPTQQQNSDINFDPAALSHSEAHSQVDEAQAEFADQPTFIEPELSYTPEPEVEADMDSEPEVVVESSDFLADALAQAASKIAAEARVVEPVAAPEPTPAPEPVAAVVAEPAAVEVAPEPVAAQPIAEADSAPRIVEHRVEANLDDLKVDEFAALEERVLRAVTLVRKDREARHVADRRAEAAEMLIVEQAQRIDRLEGEIRQLREERDVVRQRVERLLAQLDSLDA